MDYNNFGGSASKKYQDDTLNRVRKEHQEALKKLRNENFNSNSPDLGNKKSYKTQERMSPPLHRLSPVNRPEDKKMRSPLDDKLRRQLREGNTRLPPPPFSSYGVPSNNRSNLDRIRRRTSSPVRTERFASQDVIDDQRLEIKYLERIVHDQGSIIDNLTSRITRLESIILNTFPDRGENNSASLEHSNSFSGFPTNKAYGLQMGGLHENGAPYRRSSDNIKKEKPRLDRPSSIHLENESTEDILKILSSSFHN
ncbi:spc29p [Saccharomyces arboricola H-6]|uniref:Spindle pole component 29 n=1 Tax=Saccharomyces arboricola (strain H-6 / AS 2.3317 / CBS 10644) TaxID=1160507 RepID=J8Q1A3_SACAR|nr:spc29p [Saccharomyces arboricola H-6]